MRIYLALGVLLAGSAVAEPVPPSPQRPGDPTRGAELLRTTGVAGCGVPSTAHDAVFGRALPLDKTRFVTARGVSVVGPNCFSCHAGRLLGEQVLGLGVTDADYTRDRSAGIGLAAMLLKTPAERAALRKFEARARAVAPYLRTRTRGVNPADNLAAALFAHRDPSTLRWSEKPLMKMPEREPVPVDVPPLWHLKKKNALYYTASGTGDHARLMTTASTLCIDEVEQARAVDAAFPDIAAYLRTLEPPKWPFALDRKKAARGAEHYAARCASCHGTGDRYPNRVIDVDQVGTDPALAERRPRFEAWFNASFYGEKAQLRAHTGYIAPPLDGIWASAPYLHNGSVPTLAALLDSRARPARWSRSFASEDYDEAHVGWRVLSPRSRAPSEVYDTRAPGYSNAGHTYADGLTADERAALLEYLKTL